MRQLRQRPAHIAKYPAPLFAGMRRVRALFPPAPARLCVHTNICALRAHARGGGRDERPPIASGGKFPSGNPALSVAQPEWPPRWVQTMSSRAFKLFPPGSPVREGRWHQAQGLARCWAQCWARRQPGAGPGAWSCARPSARPHAALGARPCCTLSRVSTPPCTRGTPHSNGAAQHRGGDSSQDKTEACCYAQAESLQAQRDWYRRDTDPVLPCAWHSVAIWLPASALVVASRVVSFLG